MDVFDGIAPQIDEWLGLQGSEKFGTRCDVPKYASQSAAIALSENGEPLRSKNGGSVTDLIWACMQRLERNLANQHTSDGKETNFLLDDFWMNHVFGRQ